jgi:DNA helicase-2/ATP-dependent DNA helicase PcrA
MSQLDFENSLNDQQLIAVNCNEGNKLVLAGAGSGKTRVLTYRIAKLIQDFNVRPSDVLALTFTNKASREMKDRIESILKISSQGLWFGTFHGICRRILKIHWREAELSERFTILDSQDQLRLIKRILKGNNYDEKLYDPKSIQSFINRKKDNGQRSNNISDKDDEVYVAIFKEYEIILKQTMSVDFADLILKTYELFRSHTQILNYYTKRFKHIMVDEFQDTNLLQFKLLKLLNNDTGSLYAVGDDDQSIYGWRGALSKNIKSFTDQFTDVEIFKLEQNYRSTNKILKVANSLISHNKNRLGKELWTASERGETVKIFEAYNNDEESSFIVDKIKMLERDGYKKSEIAILYRNNFLSRRLEEELNGRGIPYVIYGGFRFFERSEIKDMIAYLRVIVNPDDDSAFERTINNPPRGIGQKTIDIIRKFAKADNRSLWKTIKSIKNQNNDEISSRVKTSLTNYISLIEIISNEINDLSLDEILIKIYKESKLKSYYSEQKGEEAISKQENIEELFITAENFIKNNYDSENIIDDFLDNAALEAGDYQSKLDNDPVQLMTIHSAKGLEFPVVFLTGLEEGIFPNENRKSGEDFLEEERRLCYVAITRAMKSLYITFANARYLHGSYNYLMPSRFISEIPDELLESVKSDNYQHVKNKNVIPLRKKDDHKHGFKIGQRVKHQKFGSGVVLSYEGEDDNLKLYINFEDYGSKWLVLTYAHLEFL